MYYIKVSDCETIQTLNILGCQTTDFMSVLESFFIIFKIKIKL